MDALKSTESKNSESRRENRPENRCGKKLSRRHFILGGVATIVAGVGGLLAPIRAWANWPKELFTQTEFKKTMKALTEGFKVKKKEMLTVPRIAENGGQVRVSVNIEDVKVTKISLVVEKNPVPLTSQFLMTGKTVPKVGINLKVRETSRITVLAESNGTIYKDEAKVQVSAGGCG